MDYPVRVAVFLFFSFSEKLGDIEYSEIPCQPWTTRMPKYAQPDLNFVGKRIKVC